MSHAQKNIIWPTLLVAVAILGALAFVAGRTRRSAEFKEKKSALPGSERRWVQGRSTRGATPRPRNLSLQPEAFNMGRRLGQRFSPGKRERSILVGTVAIGSERRIVQTTRTQTDNGEQVEIKLAGSLDSLTWDAAQGALSLTRRATGGDRELIERFVFDSPDQFVLAQLRGAGYYTVARNVRADGSGENYSGALWNVVRVDDSETDETKRPQSRWRLYYVNAATGLIDRIVSDIQGQRIIAEFTWAEILGEKVPAQITWTRQGQPLMQYELTSFAHAQEGAA
jgi:hypothetical protein